MNYKKCSKKSNNEYKYLKDLVTRILISIIILLSVGISIKINDENSYYVQKYLFLDSLKFTKVKNWYEENIGKLIPDLSQNSQMVFKSNGFVNYENEKYEEGVKISINKNDFVSNIKSGIVVFIGDKDKYGKTVIIQGNDGIDYWYGNISNIGVSLYDYIEKDTLLGSPKDDFIYLVLKKGNEIVNYDEYIKENKN